MRVNLFIAALLAICFISCTSKEEKIKNVVNRWNDLHNKNDVESFKTLYTDNVLFYGKQTSAANCYAKKKAFLTSSFKQDIISPITLTYYSSGIVKADFTKRTQYRTEKVREYYCYLLLQKQGGQYLVSGESDVLSDQKRNTQLDLGYQVAKTRSNAFIYITLLLLTFGFGVFIWLRKKKKRELDWQEFMQVYKAPVEEQPQAEQQSVSVVDPDENLVKKIKNAVLQDLKNMGSIDASEKQKGDAFEKYVVARFDKFYFKLKEWRSDKYHEGKYAMSSLLPDLEYEFNTSYHKILFAVECKWRAAFQNNKIEWAKERQLTTYRKYAFEKNLNVYVIVGVGGRADEPENVYILPLSKIKSVYLFESELKRFKRFQNGDFFLNGDSMELS